MRTTTLLLQLAVAVSVTACGSNTPPEPSASARATGPLRSTSVATTPAATRTAGPGSTPALPGPTASPATTTPAPGASQAPDGEELLPTPTTTDVVLLVAANSSLSSREQQWLTDLRQQFGNVGTLAYRDVNLEALRAFFVVFVIDKSADLDVSALGEAFRAGLTVHLIGAAAEYRAAVGATATP